MPVAGLLAFAAAAWGQSPEPSADRVDSLTRLARASLPLARLEDGKPVPKETEEELAQPIISRALEVRIVRLGEVSAMMGQCGLDWRAESFLPVMDSLRANGWSGKKMAYVGILHGVSQGLTERGFETRRRTCKADEIVALRKEAASIPAATL